LYNKLAVSKWFGLTMALVPWCAWADYEYPGGALHLGYRMDNLDWNISGEGNQAGAEPNILSELEWRDLQIFELKGELSGASHKQIYFRGFASYGWVLDGENQDSDYAGDDRTLEFSRSINDVDGSRVMDFKGAVGPEIAFGQREQHRFIPLIGYSYHTQRLRMTNGNQVLWGQNNADSFSPGSYLPLPLGPFPGLNSSYEANWSGFWLGADLLLDLQDSGTVFASVELHRVDYYAEADWNLRSDLAHPVSFEHEANAGGLVMELGWRQPTSRYRWTWGANLVLQSWTTGSGIDRTYLVDPAPPCNGYCYTEGKLNEVNWSSASVAITLRKQLSR
jgi:hypothetical protein